MVADQLKRPHLFISPHSFFAGLFALLTLLATVLFISHRLTCSGSGDCSDPRPATGIVWNEIEQLHDLPGSPDSPSRTTAIIRRLKEQDLWRQLGQIPPRAATRQELEYVHSREYVDRVERWARGGTQPLSREKYAPYFSPVVFDAAKSAAGSLIDLSLAVASGRFKNGFAIIRPPGHHAGRDFAKGYCIFNNVAIATEALFRERHFKRIAIVDFDAHHGNGTDAIFHSDSRVLYISMHEKDFWPYSGNEIGGEKGGRDGSVINIPMPVTAGDPMYFEAMQKTVIPAVVAFQPELIFVSAGYDGHWTDYMASLGITLSGFAQISRQLVRVAEDVSGGKIVFALEGGYDREALAYGATNSIKALLGRNDFLDPIGPPSF